MQRSHAITGKTLLLNHVATEEALRQQSSCPFLDDTKPIVLLSTTLLWSERPNIARSLSVTNHEGKLYTKTLVPNWKSETSSSSLHAGPGAVPAHIQGFVALKNNPVFHVLTVVRGSSLTPALGGINAVPMEVTLQKHKPSRDRFTSLPPEILQLIADDLQLLDATSFSLCNRRLSIVFGSKYCTQLHASHNNASQRSRFLLALARDIPSWFFCH